MLIMVGCCLVDVVVLLTSENASSPEWKKIKERKEGTKPDFFVYKALYKD